MGFVLGVGINAIKTMKEPTMADGETVWSCPSRSEPGINHTIDLEARNGKAACDCADFRFRAKIKGECDHIRRVFRAFAEHKLKEVMQKRGTLGQRMDGP